MQVLRRTRLNGRTAAASDHREEPGQRSGDPRCDHQQILESLSAVSSERDLAARCRHRHQPRATIDGWVMRVGDLLMPLVAVMGNQLVGGTYIQADETPVDVQTRDGRSRNHPGYLWQYGTPGGAAIFEFRMGRGREGPMRFLE